MIGGGAPFVLLDDARTSGAAPARLYRDPVAIVETRDPQEVSACLARLRDSKLHAAGFLSYEAGPALEPKLAPLCAAPPALAPPLLWFGLFEGFADVDAEALLPDPASGWASAPRPLVARGDHEAALALTRAHIEAGDIYQANFTFRAEVRTAGNPLAVYAALRRR
jgi:para-aminobenzoate synthetase/4-amino-4-deoxychorismate lyase